MSDFHSYGVKNMGSLFITGLLWLAVLTFASCSAGTAEEKDTFMGYWVIGDNEYTLDIDSKNVMYIDNDDINGIIFKTSYTAESPRLLSFTVNDKYPATVEYNESDKTATLIIKGYMDDGSDYTITFKPENRLDLVTPYIGADQLLLKSMEDDTVIDTIFRGETRKWVKDTLASRVVRLEDGRLAYGDINNLKLTRGQLTDVAFERTYSRSNYNEYEESYSFVRKGDKIGIEYNYMRLDGNGAGNTVTYVGRLEGTRLLVTSQIDDYVKFSEGDFSVATPLENSFTIYIIDNIEEPFIVRDGKPFKEARF